MVGSEQTSSLIADVTHETREGVLTVTLVGRAGVQILTNYVAEHIGEWVAHDKLIYDLRRWDLDSLTVDAFHGLPESFSAVHKLRAAGRAALVIQPHLEELANILIAIYESSNLPVELAYFFELEPAESWLAALSIQD